MREGVVSLKLVCELRAAQSEREKLFVVSYLWCLRPDLSRTSERSVDFTHVCGSGW